MTKEKLIEQIMKEAEKDGEPVTKEEATEMAEMEIKANGIKTYEKSDKPRKPSTRERRVDEKKKVILGLITDIVLPGLHAQNVVSKTETEVSFTYEGDDYSIKLIKHRPPKNGG